MTTSNINIGLIVLVACLVSVPPVATAQNNPAQNNSDDRPPGGGFIERLDRDGDGLVSQDEFDGPAEHFSDFDQDGDGYLSEDEAPKGPPPGRRGGRRGGNGRQ